MDIDSRYKGIPRFVYGAAFKGDETAVLVEQAILQGFVGIDTAGFTGSYKEKLTVEGIRAAMRAQGLKRPQIHIATKFTPYTTSRIPTKYFPYDPTAPIETQVHQSVTNSLTLLDNSINLGNAHPPAYVDMLTLHFPYPTIDETLRAWKAMENFVLTTHQATALGVSNIFIDKLRILYAEARVKPVLVQNCFFDTDGESAPGTPPTWDREVRAFCREMGIVYQPYATLKRASTGLLRSEAVMGFAGLLGVEVEVALYLFVLGLGEVSILDGTRRRERMTADLEGTRMFDEWVGVEGNKAVWEGYMDEFRKLVGDA